MSEYVLESQDDVVRRKSEGEKTGNDYDKQAASDDIYGKRGVISRPLAVSHVERQRQRPCTPSS